MTDRIEQLWDDLKALRLRLRQRSQAKFSRVNPFAEDLFDWKEKGSHYGGNDVTIYDSTTVVGDVTIGDSTWVGPFCSLDGTGGLRIGSHCSISAGTHLQTHDTVKWALSGGAAPYDYAPVTVGDRCFIGVNAVVTKGVSIGECSVVAAGSVVTSDVAAYSIVAGVPARVIGQVVVGDRGDVELRMLPR